MPRTKRTLCCQFFNIMFVLLTTKSSNNYEMFNMHKVSSIQKRTEKKYLQWMRAMKKDYTFQVFHHHQHHRHHNSIVFHHNHHHHHNSFVFPPPPPPQFYCFPSFSSSSIPLIFLLPLSPISFLARNMNCYLK